MATSTRRTAITILVATAALLLMQPVAANACSCLQPDIERDLPMADAAVVGTVERRTDPAADVRDSIRIRIEHVAKGDVDQPFVDVYSPGSSASCGLGDMPTGQRIGLLLTHVDEGSWSSNLCQLVDPDELAEVEPEQVPDDTSSSLLARLTALLRALCAGSAAG